ncbi:MAG: LysR family transcriptional regulator [Planctomycetota bacterium]|nr:LysR family transcriptional regulator [Planctomycetota bacterium]
MNPTGPLLDRLDLPGIEAFLAVAREGSVLRAAERLGRSQPSISARLAGLESSWKVRLFRRTGRGMTLTAEGRRRLPSAERVWDALASFEATLAEAPENDEWRLGAGDALGRRLLPAVLKRALSRNPSLSIRLEEGPGGRLLRRLRDGAIDLAWLPEDDRVAAGADIRLEPLVDSEIRVLTPAGHPRRRFRPESFERERWIGLPPGSSFRRWIDRRLSAAGVVSRPAVEVGSLSLARRFAAAGLGIAPVPGLAFDARESRGTLRVARVAGFPRIAFLAATRAGAPEPVYARALRAAVRSVGARKRGREK